MTTKDLRHNIEKVLGNSIRCLLPSYWWKRLFHQVADTIDEVNGVDIVSSKSALNRLDAPVGSLASVANKKVMKLSECYVPTDEDNNLTDEELYAKLTPVTGIEMNFPLPDISTADTSIRLIAEGGTGVGLLIISKGFCTAFFDRVGETQRYWILSSQIMVDGLNEYLSQQRWYFLYDPEEVGAENMALFDSIFTIVDCTSDVYVKGLSWERLAKESALEGIEGGSGSAEIKEEVDALKAEVDALKDKSKVVRVYASIGKEGSLDNVVLPDEYRERNKEIYERVENGEVLFADIYGGYDYAEGQYYTDTRYFNALKGTLAGNRVVFRIEKTGYYESLVTQIEISAGGDAWVYHRFMADKEYVDNAIANAITNTLNTPV